MDHISFARVAPRGLGDKINSCVCIYYCPMPVISKEPLVRAGGYGITSRGPARFSGNDVGPPEHMD